MTPPPPVLPNSDDEATEQRFGFKEARARKDAAKLNQAPRSTGTAPQSAPAGPQPQGTQPPTARPPIAPDGGARDGAPFPLSR
jgi:hypothetical protein